MNSKLLENLLTDEVSQKRLVKLLVRDCFRNGKIESFHGGTFPSSEIGDYSDVKVITPSGEIAWNKLSRLSDKEMKELMIDVINRTYTFLSKILTEEGEEFLETLKKKEQKNNKTDNKK